MHLSQLSRNIHKNVHLQNSFNKHGIGNFSFEVLELCNNVYDREIYWIRVFECYKQDKGYNRSLGGDGFSTLPEVKLKLSKSLTGKKASDSHRLNQSISQRRRYEDLKQREKQGDPYREKVLQLDLNGNLIKEWPSFRQASRALGISQGLISDCCNPKKKYNKTAGGFIWQKSNTTN